MDNKSTEELQLQLKEINAELDEKNTLFKTNLWLKKLKIIMELSYRVKK